MLKVHVTADRRPVYGEGGKPWVEGPFTSLPKAANHGPKVRLLRRRRRQPPSRKLVQIAAEGGLSQAESPFTSPPKVAIHGLKAHVPTS